MIDDLIASHPRSAQPGARLAGPCGYRLEGDSALLQAQVEWFDGARADVPWSLQLWATAGAQAAVKVADLSLQPGVGHVAVEGWAVALPPAGAGAHTLWLELTAASTVTGLPEVHDQMVFERAEHFLQPGFQGAVNCRCDGAQALVSLEQIGNPRDASNLSGSLTVELWALAQPYAGGAFAGYCLARADLGTLAGQSYWRDVELALPLASQPAETPCQCLMLREWTLAGPVCRDYLNLATAEVAAEATAPAVEPVTEVVAEPVAEPAAEPVAPPAAVAPAAPKKAAAAAEATVRFSVNRATEAQLASVKGISKTIAKAIVAGRPYATLDELVEVKGLGKKTLAKVRDQLMV